MNILGKSLAAVCMAFPLLALADTVTIRADKWFPMNGNPKDALPGYMIEMATEILAKHGHSVDYKTMTWEQSLADVRAGHFDCVVGAGHDDAPDFLFPEESMGKMRNVMYVRKGNDWKYTGIESLAAVRLGAIEAYTYSDELDAYIEANKDSPKVRLINANNGLAQNIKKLKSVRIDVVVESDVVMQAKLKEMGMTGEIVPAGELDSVDDLFIACSPAKESSKTYVKLLTDGVKAMRASGRLKEILDKYGLVDWQ